MSIKNLFIYSPDSDGSADKRRADADLYSAIRKSDSPPRTNNRVNDYIKNNITDKNTFTYNTGKVSGILRENLDFINDAFELPKNFDFVLREFTVRLCDREVNAFLIFYDGLVNADYINRDILNPLMSLGSDTDAPSNEKLEDTVYKSLISQAPNDKKRDMREIIEMVEFGNCAVFVDGCACAFVADVKGWSGRDVGKPITEAVLSGPQEAFNEKVMTNIGLVRKIVKDANLIAEKIAVGSKSKTPCALMYINGITNVELVAEVRRRLTSLETEYIFSSADIEMLIEDSAAFPLPQILKTERPDRAAAQLADGKVVVIVQGSPFALILPATAADLLEASEDNYVRVAEANFMRIVRTIGILLALLLPGFFIGTVLYHHESIPTDLLFAIEATREQMPFPIVLELVIMILAFELIKEASIRVPDPIGSTLGIVGGLILGQAAVSANIASPLLIIIVSISALGSFAAPSLSLSRALSVMQFVFVILGTVAGFLGLALGIFAAAILLCSASSVGIPYMSPISPKNGKASNALLIRPMWQREKRPHDLMPQSETKQPHISRRWKRS